MDQVISSLDDLYGLPAKKIAVLCRGTAACLVVRFDDETVMGFGFSERVCHTYEVEVRTGQAILENRLFHFQDNLSQAMILKDDAESVFRSIDAFTEVISDCLLFDQVFDVFYTPFVMRMTDACRECSISPWSMKDVVCWIFQRLLQKAMLKQYAGVAHQSIPKIK